MAAYTPTAADFEEFESNYKPTAADFDMIPKDDAPGMAQDYGQSEAPASGFRKGAMDEIPHSTKSIMNALAGILGKHPFDNPDLPESQSGSESFGRFAGGAIPYGLAAAPIMAGTSAFLPGLAGMAAGGALSGAALTDGDLKDRGINALIGALTPGGLKAGGALLKGAGKVGSTLARGTKAHIKGTNPAEAIEAVQGKYQARKDAATDKFGEVLASAKVRGVDNVYMDKGLIDKAHKYLGNSDAIKKVINKSYNGDYDGLRTLQTTLREEIEKDMSRGNSAERASAKEMDDVRRGINDTIHEHFQKTGHQDLANKLQGARYEYRHLMTTYEKFPDIAKVFGENKLVPENAKAFLKKKGVPYDKLRSENPELTEALKDTEAKDRLTKALLSTGVLGSAGWGGKTLYKLAK